MYSFSKDARFKVLKLYKYLSNKTATHYVMITSLPYQLIMELISDMEIKKISLKYLLSTRKHLHLVNITQKNLQNLLNIHLLKIEKKFNTVHSIIKINLVFQVLFNMISKIINKRNHINTHLD